MLKRLRGWVRQETELVGESAEELSGGSAAHPAADTPEPEPAAAAELLQCHAPAPEPAPERAAAPEPAPEPAPTPEPSPAAEAAPAAAPVAQDAAFVAAAPVPAAPASDGSGRAARTDSAALVGETDEAGIAGAAPASASSPPAPAAPAVRPAVYCMACCTGADVCHEGGGACGPGPLCVLCRLALVTRCDARAAKAFDNLARALRRPARRAARRSLGGCGSGGRAAPGGRRGTDCCARAARAAAGAAPGRRPGAELQGGAAPGARAVPKPFVTLPLDCAGQCRAWAPGLPQCCEDAPAKLCERQGHLPRLMCLSERQLGNVGMHSFARAPGRGAPACQQWGGLQSAPASAAQGLCKDMHPLLLHRWAQVRWAPR